ncbi:hypothetical protein BQ8482_290061 [Mesorhizobium delmotii]|uniref:Uncharacterized protein n=1 Tax=Mesorhizobium delmotii TaxID=1631247 RepID=A0A2P9AMX4_9HYPH|nr:hypothetical protein BQ8482_290061 [Mesorhizobium delmotii]
MTDEYLIGVVTFANLGLWCTDRSVLDVYVGCNLNDRCAAVMPFKHNSGRRHRIGKTKFKVRNWPEYEEGLRRRGSLTLWVTSEALSKRQAPRRKTLAASIAIPIWRSRPA